MKIVDNEVAFNKFKPENCVFVISKDLNWKYSWMVAGFNMTCSKKPYMYAVSISRMAKINNWFINFVNII